MVQNPHPIPRPYTRPRVVTGPNNPVSGPTILANLATASAIVGLDLASASIVGRTHVATVELHEAAHLAALLDALGVDGVIPFVVPEADLGLVFTRAVARIHGWTIELQHTHTPGDGDATT